MGCSLNARVGASVSACLLIAAHASAQLITESNWDLLLTGPQSWQVDDNWNTPTYPDDPGRVDLEPTIILPVIGANVSVGLGADLDLDVGPTDVTVASLRLGGTAGPVTTTVISSGGQLVLENKESNDSTDPENVIPAFNSSRAVIVSGGVPGSTNLINAPVFINGDDVDVGGFDGFETTNDLTFTGRLLFAEGGGSLSATTATGDIYINGPVETEYTPEGAVEPVASTAAFNTRGAGTVYLNGVVSGPGGLQVNGGGGTVVLNTANTFGGTFLPRGGTTVIANDQALGTGTFRAGGGNALMVSDDDSRTIANRVDIQNFLHVTGDHSITFTGLIDQSNTRGITNTLAPGKTLTIAGEIGADGDPPEALQNNRELFIEGSGHTVISGAMRNRVDELEDQPQSFGFSGTGKATISGTDNTYSAYTYVEGATVHYTTNDALPVADFRTRAGAVGVDTGTLYIGGNPAMVNAEFLNRVNNKAQSELTIAGDLKTTHAYDHGGVMLTPAEASANFDFTSGMLVNAAQMSLAGPAEGITYTGSVTPANATNHFGGAIGEVTVPTYRFGGGTGVITIPGDNQLTGANGLVAENGIDADGDINLGGVRVTGQNNYTGPTQVDSRTTLTIFDIADGGAPSNIGASTSAPENLFLRGGRLRYEGAGDTTDRLFTISTRGGTIDSSGAGALVFTNTGPVGIQTAEARDGITSGGGFGFETGVTQASTSVAYNLPYTDDLVSGMQIMGEYLTESGTDDDEVVTITRIQSDTRVQFSDAIGPFVNFFEDVSTLTFIDAPRTLTLTGENTDDNTLSPIIGDSPTNVVNLQKTGVGKWVLDAVNTYSGDTIVGEGVLSITNPYLDDDADVFVNSGGVFDLDFAGSDDIGALFLDDASAPLGSYGAIGSGADFESAFFTGTGLLNVTVTVPSEIPGDYNNDGVVDAADYTVYRDNVGEPEGTLLNDLEGGVVGQAQYDQWVANFGATEPPAAEGATAVPEPTAAVLALAFCVSAGWNSRRKPS